MEEEFFFLNVGWVFLVYCSTRASAASQSQKTILGGHSMSFEKASMVLTKSSVYAGVENP